MLQDAVAVLSDLGVFPVIGLVAVITLAVSLYRRFCSGGVGAYGASYDHPGAWTEDDYYNFAMRPGQYDD